MKLNGIYGSMRVVDLQRTLLEQREAINEHASEVFIRLVLFVPMLLRSLDELEGTFFFNGKMRIHAKGLIKELEGLGISLNDLVKNNPTDVLYDTLDGQRKILEWVFSLSLDDLIAIAHAKKVIVRAEGEGK